MNSVEGGFMMNTEELRKYLYKAITISNTISANLCSLQTLRDLVEGPKNSNMCLAKVKTNPTQDPLGDLLAQIVDLEDRYYQNIQQLLNRLHVIENLISNVSDDKERLILHCRYINTKKWSEVAEFTNYSEKQVHNIHNKALQSLQKYVIENAIELV